MKKIGISLLIVILVVVLYFVLGGSDDSAVLEDQDKTNITFDGIGGVEAEFVTIKDSGIEPPILKRNLTGLTKTSSDRLKLVITSIEENHLNPDDWIEIGGLWKVGGAFEAAGEAWEYALVLSPENIVSLINLGNLYANELNDLEQAESWYRKAIESEPTYIPVYFQMAEMYLYKIKNRNKAISIVEEGLKVLPNDEDLIELKEAIESGAL